MWVVLSHFRLTFRRCAVSPVFISPSKGGISANVSHRLCKAVFPKRAAYPPSEGGPYPAVSVSPSEGEHVYLYHDGREMRESVPLWKEAGEAMPSRRSVERVQRKITYRNGSESRESVPLWKEAGETTPPEGLQQGFGGKSYSAAAEKCGICYRCGRGKGVTSPTRN